MAPGWPRGGQCWHVMSGFFHPARVAAEPHGAGDGAWVWLPAEFRASFHRRHNPKPPSSALARCVPGFKSMGLARTCPQGQRAASSAHPVRGHQHHAEAGEATGQPLGLEARPHGAGSKAQCCRHPCSAPQPGGQDRPVGSQTSQYPEKPPWGWSCVPPQGAVAAVVVFQQAPEMPPPPSPLQLRPTELGAAGCPRSLSPLLDPLSCQKPRSGPQLCGRQMVSLAPRSSSARSPPVCPASPVRCGHLAGLWHRAAARDAGAGGQGKIFSPGMDAGRTSPQIRAKLQMLTYSL